MGAVAYVASSGIYLLAGITGSEADVPLLPGALRYAQAGAIPGGLGRNRRYFQGHAGGIAVDASIDPALATLLFDPQTSGGLLAAIPAADLDAAMAAFARHGASCWIIGEVTEGEGIAVVP